MEYFIFLQAAKAVCECQLYYGKRKGHEDLLKFYRTNLLEKLEEALRAVIPIILIVLFLCFTIAPLSPGLLMVFLIGAVLLVVGMMFFTLGADLAMTPIGERVGTAMTQ